MQPTWPVRREMSGLVGLPWGWVSSCSEETVWAEMTQEVKHGTLPSQSQGHSSG